ncbi:MAG: FeoB small GTPase domain-containing protein [Actinomycetota bacterium]|nr:FeoB small GTPase domain-containing protein [Actinomycetota bacterium]
MAGCDNCGSGERWVDMPDGRMRVALAGNPNTGKSSIFNLLTGAKQHVGNWPGKTVARAHGSFRHDDRDIEVIDLPGTYSLNAASPEEMIARDYLVSGEPDVAVVVVDAANLERNLYLVVQVLEIGVPSIVALNMTDVASSRRIKIDVAEISALLGVPVVSTVARSAKGLDDLKDAIVSVIEWQGVA